MNGGSRRRAPGLRVQPRHSQAAPRTPEASPWRACTSRVRTGSCAPAEKTQRFTLGQIGNFLYKLEADSRRVKVTYFKIQPFEKVAPGQVGKDAWNFEAELTTRGKDEKSAGT